MLDPTVTGAANVRMNTETYLNHPTFGLLYRICLIENDRELFATLYAQRLFFVVTIGTTKGIQFESIGRAEARVLVETRLRDLRRSGRQEEHIQLQAIHKQTFQ